MKYDAIIIGFGKGGKTLAGALAKQGKKVALIEKSAQMYGGTCINVGCIPSKSLVTSAKESAKHADAPFEEKAALYANAIAEKIRVTTLLRGKNFDKLDSLDNVTIYNGLASFVSNTEVQVQTAAETFVLTGENIFINTGSTPVLPPIKGLRENPFVYTSEGMMALPELPRRLAIIGGGYIGLEFASMYTSFGSKVTVVQDGDVFLPREDADIAAEIKSVLEKRGVSFVTGAKITEIAGEQAFASVHFTKDSAEYQLEAEAVLVATGRRPNTDALNAAAAGVDLTPRGAVQVNEHLKTTAPNIWAMGDVVGGLQFTYISLDDYRIVLSQLNGGEKTTANRKNIPYSVFLSVPFSRVGLNEQEAKDKGYNVKIVKMPAAAIPKAQVLRTTDGILKAVIDADSGKILGAMLFCEESYEMINLVKLAMDADLPYTALRDGIYTHPTMTEAFNDLFAL